MVLNSFSLHVGDKGFKEQHGPREENNFFTSKSKRICRLNKKNDHSFFSFQHLNILVVLALVIKVPMVIYSFFLQLSKYRYVTINENSLRYSVGPSGYNLFLLCPLVSMFYTLL